MELATSVDTRPVQAMKDGTETRSLYIKNVSLGDWQLIKQMQGQFADSEGPATVADIIRMAVRKLAGCA